MNPGDILHGFELKYSQPLPELKATLHRFTYLKNGADAIWLEREDDNKSFAIAFRTVPEDDTGVFHILEHSVLNGSEKYPLREPFVELIKSSLATFINAMTAPDMTIYPVSSRNDKDFLNLMDVYMDAVLHPLSLRDPHSFRQEGWHYELESPEGELTVNGVVFNEMKGAYTSQDELIRDKLNRLMFPDTCYGKDSGGDPDHIPELSYEEYVADHHRFYHPSNSYIFLDGSLDLDAAFEKLDGYLKDYDKIDPDSEIAVQAPVTPPEATCCYPIGAGDDDKNKALLGKGWVYGRFDEVKKNLAVSALLSALAGTNDAPLTRALLEAGLCEDVALERCYGGFQTYVKLILKNCDPEKKDEIWALADKVLAEQAEGMDRKRLNSVISRMEFLNREKDFGGISKGLVYGLSCMDSWLYGGDPSLPLMSESLFAPLYEMVEAGGFEQLLKEVFISCEHFASVVMLPSKTMADEKRAQEKERLSKLKASWDDETRSRVISEFKALRERQNTPDTPETLAKLPRLKLSDIPARRTPLPSEVKQLDGTVLLHQDVETDGISYLSLCFSLADFDAEELSRASILASLVSSVATENYDVAALRSETNEKLGRFSVFSQMHAGSRRCEPFVTVNIALLEAHKPDAVRLTDEILNRSLFTDKDYIINLIRQNRIGSEQRVMMEGNFYAATRAAASCTVAGAMREALSGMQALRTLQKTEKEYSEATLEGFAALAKKIFVRERVTLSLTGKMDEAWLREMLGVLARGEKPVAARLNLLPACAQGYVIPSEIGFAARVAPLKTDEKGVSQVASQFLTYDYLWNEIRVKGGAYGTGFRMNEADTLVITSYRDPAAAQSLDSFMKTPQALRAFCESDDELTRYIISTIGNIDPLRTPRSIAGEAAWMYFSGTTEQDRTREWEQVLSTDKAKLAVFADKLEGALAGSALCVVGGQAAIDACGDRLEKVEPVQQ